MLSRDCLVLVIFIIISFLDNPTFISLCICLHFVYTEHLCVYLSCLITYPADDGIFAEESSLFPEFLHCVVFIISYYVLFSNKYLQYHIVGEVSCIYNPFSFKISLLKGDFFFCQNIILLPLFKTIATKSHICFFY